MRDRFVQFSNELNTGSERLWKMQWIVNKRSIQISKERGQNEIKNRAGRQTEPALWKYWQMKRGGVLFRHLFWNLFRRGGKASWKRERNPGVQRRTTPFFMPEFSSRTGRRTIKRIYQQRRRAIRKIWQKHWWKNWAVRQCSAFRWWAVFPSPWSLPGSSWQCSLSSPFSWQGT